MFKGRAVRGGHCGAEYITRRVLDRMLAGGDGDAQHRLSHQTEETTPAPRETSALLGTSAGQWRIFWRARPAGKWCGQARVMRRLRTCPLGQLQGNGQSCFPYLPREQHAKLTASAGVTDVTGHASPRSSFFGREPAMKSRPAPRETSAARCIASFTPDHKRVLQVGRPGCRTNV
jgi:hypothetical protein